MKTAYNSGYTQLLVYGKKNQFFHNFVIRLQENFQFQIPQLTCSPETLAVIAEKSRNIKYKWTLSKIYLSQRHKRI